MMDPIRVGVIGIGGRAQHLARVLMHDPKKRGDLVAICDIHSQTLASARKTIQKLMKHDIETYTDYKQLLANESIDAVIIGTPDHLHHEMAVAAFAAKKHVFLEKPVGINLDQMHEIVTAAKNSGKTIEIGYVLRYSPFYIEAKKMIEGELGRPLFAQMLEQYYGGAPVFFRGWWRLRKNVGGIMVQKICHDMDLWYWLFGKPKSIAAFTSNMEFKPGNWPSEAAYCSECTNHCPYYTKANPDRNHSDECLYNTDKTGADIADNAQVLVQFENGLNLSMGMNFFNSRGQDDRFLRIVGSKGEITGQLGEQILRFDPRHDPTLSETILYECAPGGLGGHGGGDEVQILEFLQGLHEGREAKAGLESAYWSSILVMGAQLSADIGKVVQVADLVGKYPFPN